MNCQHGMGLIQETQKTAVTYFKRVIVFMVLAYMVVFRQKDSAVKQGCMSFSGFLLRQALLADQSIERNKSVLLSINLTSIVQAHIPFFFPPPQTQYSNLLKCAVCYMWT